MGIIKAESKDTHWQIMHKHTQPDTKLIKAISLDFYYKLFDFYAVKRSDTKVTIKASNTIE